MVLLGLVRWRTVGLAAPQALLDSLLSRHRHAATVADAIMSLLVLCIWKQVRPLRVWLGLPPQA